MYTVSNNCTVWKKMSVENFKYVIRRQLCNVARYEGISREHRGAWIETQMENVEDKTLENILGDTKFTQLLNNLTADVFEDYYTDLCHWIAVFHRATNYILEEESIQDLKNMFMKL